MWNSASQLSLINTAQIGQAVQIQFSIFLPTPSSFLLVRVEKKEEKDILNFYIYLLL